MKNLDRIRKQLPAARRRRIAARAATLVAEEKSLQELRQAHKGHLHFPGKRAPESATDIRGFTTARVGIDRTGRRARQGGELAT